MKTEHVLLLAANSLTVARLSPNAYIKFNPETQAELVWRALQNGWDQTTLVTELRAQTQRRLTS